MSYGNRKLIVVDADGQVLETCEPWLGHFDKERKFIWLHGIECRQLVRWVENVTEGVTTATVGKRDFDEERRWATRGATAP